MFFFPTNYVRMTDFCASKLVALGMGEGGFVYLQQCPEHRIYFYISQVGRRPLAFVDISQKQKEEILHAR